MPSSEEDGGKKRQVHPIEDETPKKVKVDDVPKQSPSSSKEPPAPSTTTTTTTTTTTKPTPPSSSTPSNVASKPSPESADEPDVPSPSFNLEKIRSMWKDKDRPVWDLEGALLYLVQELDEREYLTHDETVWVTFRVGHAGDASTIANWYRLAKKLVLEQEAAEENNNDNDLDKEEEEEEEEDPEIETDQVPQQIPTEPARSEEEEDNASNSAGMLEVWLADGFGDDRRLPYVYGLVADVHMVSASSKQVTEPYLSPSSDQEEDEDHDDEEEEEEEDQKKEATVDEIIDIPPGDLKKSAVTKELGAVALLTTGFDEGLEKILKIEWLGLNPDLPTAALIILRQRVWLRLSTLAVMMGCDGGIEWEQRFSLDPLQHQHQQHQEQQQEQQQEKEQQEQQEGEEEEFSKKPPARVSPRAE